MDKIIIEGGQTRLDGEVVIEGAKNAVLPLLAATILPESGKTILRNVPILSDVFTMNNVVRGLGISVEFNEDDKEILRVTFWMLHRMSTLARCGHLLLFWGQF